MGATDKAKNKAQAAKGRIKNEAGALTGDRSLQAKGAAERAAGDVKQAGEKVKDAVRR